VDQHFAGLLACRHDQRRIALVGGDQAPHRVADACGGVEIDQRRSTGRLRETVGHRDHRRLLQRKHVGEIGREVLQERLFGRRRVAEHRRQSQRA
jgi:hypothetical protein